MKNFIAIILFTISVNVWGQSTYDALRFSQKYYEGTARSLSLGNAVTAIGGDLGAVSINPASSGVYKHSEFVFTPSVFWSIDETNYLDINTRKSTGDFGVSNIGWVGYYDTGRTRGLRNLNFSIVANKNNNYFYQSSASGVDNITSWSASMAANMPNIPGYDLDMINSDPDKPFYEAAASWKSILGWNTMLLDTIGGYSNYIAATENIDGDGYFYQGGPLSQSYSRKVEGYSTDITFNTGGNISDKFFFGLNLTIQNINYFSTDQFSERAINPNNFDTKFESVSHAYYLNTTGVGFGLKTGIIYLPVKGLRIGASISTPTTLFLTDRYEEEMQTSINGETIYIDTPVGLYNYKITSPFVWNYGMAYLTKYGFISVDYENTVYSNIRVKDNNNMELGFAEVNQNIERYLQGVHNLRVGMEVRPIQSFALRAGYNYYSSPEKDFDYNTHFVSGGLGYVAPTGFFIDAVFQSQLKPKTESYLLFDSYQSYDDPSLPIGVPVATSKFTNWKLALSIGFKF